MKHVNISTYEPRKGSPMSGRSMTQLAGYVPSEKRAADLLMAGLIRQAVADEYYDSQFEYAGMEDVPPIPPLSRAFPQDLADVYQLAAEYRERSRIINERIQMAVERGQPLKVPSTVSTGEGVQPQAGQGAAPPGGEAPPEV